MNFPLGSILTPALVSLIISLWANSLSEGKRARRDHLTRLFESARDDIRRASEAGIEYFSTPPKERKPQQEAKILAADREIRAALSLLLDDKRSPACKEETDAARQDLESFLMALTGGNFQTKEGGVSHDHLLRLAHAGAKMRTSLARLRDADLKVQFERYGPISRLEMLRRR